jgi:hypothetical protein
MKLKIQVGEPKGFDAGDGTNVFIASVEEGLSGSREVDALPRAADVLAGNKTSEKLTEHWFVLSCSPIKYMDGVITSILLIPRYKTKVEPLAMLAEGERLVFNVVWRQDGLPWDAASVLAAQNDGIEIGGMLVANAEMVKE